LSGRRSNASPSLSPSKPPREIRTGNEATTTRETVTDASGKRKVVITKRVRKAKCEDAAATAAVARRLSGTLQGGTNAAASAAVNGGEYKSDMEA